MVRLEREDGVRILSVLRDIVGDEVSNRARGADASTDLIQEYSDAETLTLTFALACVYEVETDPSALEAQLHALAEFAEHGALPQVVLHRVLSVDKADLEGSAREHLGYLIETAGVE